MKAYTIHKGKKLDFLDVLMHLDKLDALLKEKYLSEFVVIDGLNQHPKGLNFKQWLASK